MPKWKILISAPYMQPELDRFRPIFAENDLEIVAPSVNERLSEADLLPWVGDLDGVICGDDQFTARVLQAAPKLKVISKWGTGIDSIDQATAKTLGIAVRNTPNAFSEPVADTVLGYMLCFARQLPWMTHAMRQGRWDKRPSFSLQEAKLGVIGVGDVGKAVVRRASALKMRVLGHDLVEMPADFLAETGIQMVTKADLLTQADFVSLNCDLNPTSYHLMSSTQFSLMKSTAVIINTARGPLIDEPALIKALQTQQIGGAALDVFEVEPLPVDSPLKQMDNVMLAPHNANSSPKFWEHVHHNSINNLLEELRRAA